MTAQTENTADLDGILPEEGGLVVEGIPATVKRLKSREFLQLIRVLTRGLGENAGMLDLNGDESEVQGKLIAMFVMAIPEAHEEFQQFVFGVVEPVSSAQKDELRKALDNPELEVLIDVLTLIAVQEAPDFRSLVGKLKAALVLVQKAAFRPTGK